MSGTSLGRLSVDLLAKTSGFETDMGRAARVMERRAQEIDRAVSGMGSRVVGGFKTAASGALAFVGAAVSVEAAIAAIGRAIQNADRVDELSQRLGIGAEKLSAWGFAAKLAGSDLESLGSAVPKLSKQISAAADPTSSAAKLFDALGIDVKDTEGRLRDVEEVLPEVSDRFRELNDDTIEQTLAMELFGKSGAELLEFLNNYSDLMGKVPENAIISAETASRAAEFGDQVDRLKGSLSGLTSQVAAELLPNLIQLVELTVDFVEDGGNAASIAGAISLSFKVAASNVLALRDALSAVGEASTSALNVFGDFLEASGIQDKAGEAAALASIQGLARRDALQDSFRNVVTTVSSTAIKPQSRGTTNLDRRLGRYFGGSGQKARSAPKRQSEEDQAAERLQQAYDRLNAQLDERIALFGKEGEAAKIRYDLEFGALKGLEKVKADELIADAERLDQMREEADLQEKLDEMAERQAERYESVVADLQAEAEAYGLTNLELRTRNELLRAGVELDTAQGQAIADLVAQSDKAEKLADTMDNVRGIAYDFLIDLPKGGKDAWKNALDSIEAMLLQWAAKGIIDQLFGEGGTTGGGSFFGDLLGGLLGGGGGATKTGSNIKGSGGGGFDWGGLFASLFGGGRADGGPVFGGKLYDVTERGMPELLSIGSRQLMIMPPGRSGMVRPMAAAGGGFGQTNNFYLSAPTDPRTQEQIADRTGFTAQRAMNRNR